MNYHDKYYKLDNMIICDDDYNIVKDSYIYRRNKKVEFSFDSLKLSITLNWYKNYALIRKYKTWRDYYMFFFLRELLDAYFSFKYRYVKHRYYYDLETFFFRTEELNILVVSWGFDIDFDLEFFEKFKETFYNIISFDYRKKGIVINKLLTWDIIKLEEVINYIKSIDYKNVLDLLWRKRDYKAR
jgi:hypothetical protein